MTRVRGTRLRMRLLFSYLIVIVVGIGVVYLTVRLLAPALFDQRVHGSGPAGSGTTVRSAMRTALNTALLAAVIVSLAAALVLASFAGRRLTRPIDALRAATRRIAAGDYQVQAPASSVPELAELASDVNTLAATLADTEARRARLIGDVAHEMRTPLTTLDGYVEGMVDGVFTADEQTLGTLAGELSRLHRLADDLASLSRAEENRLDLRPRRADLAELTRNVATRLGAQFDDAEVRLAVDAPVAVPVVVDPQRLEQVVTNLLGNALAATPPGGSVTASVRRSGGSAEVAVADTGVGLSADDVDRIFERFYRVDPRRGSGTGIGLTIARGLVRAHDGDLTAASGGPGHGSTFTVTLPADASRSGPPSEP